jgi:ribosomal protein S8E
VNLSAVLEPDADGDGYGDVTQDLCPTNAATHDACPTQPTSPPPTTAPATAPDTVLVGQVAKKTSKRKVTLRFSSPTAGATFRCQVDQAAAKPCSSPFKKKYKLGKHTVVITAVSPAGIADPTPLKVSFKVKVKAQPTNR